MWSKIKNGAEYTAQITPYHGYVIAEILCTNEYYKEAKSGLWLTVMDKSFGSMFRRTPTEKNYIDAKKWVDQQFALIEKHGTSIITMPKWLVAEKSST